MSPSDGVPWNGERWAVPGSVADPSSAPGPAPSLAPASVPPGTGKAGGTGGEAGPWAGTAGPFAESAPAEVPHITLKPMTVADVLDGAFSIIKARPVRIFGVTALFVVPVTVLLAYLQRGFYNDWLALDLYSSDPAVLSEDTQSPVANEGLMVILGLVLPGLALVGVAAAIARLVRGWSYGQDPSAGELLGGVARSTWPLVASFLVVRVAEGLGGLVCFVGAVFVMPFFSVTAPVIGMEDAGPITAVKRSASLVGKRYWPVLGLNLLIALVATVLGLALGGLPGFVGGWFSDDVAWLLVAVGDVVSSVVTTPFVAAAAVLMYLDLRVRTEGIDLEMTAREVLDDVVPTTA